ncbi:MAG: PAS domain-containing sensor histidine kinase [Muribaculaceae bacterium]|nr:PAS domain-containing sensor histidine kinase [Muribaculaceae bacterium]
MRNSWLFLLLCVAVIVPSVMLVALCGPQWRYETCAAVLIEVCVLIVVYRSLFRPIKVIAGGMSLLREQDFSSRLRHVGQADADKVVDMFNSMMDRLKIQNLRMQEQNAFLNKLVDASPMGVIILNDRNEITLFNNAAAQMLGMQLSGEPRLVDLESPLGKALGLLGADEVKTVKIDGRDIFRCSRLFFMDRGWRHPFILIERLTEEVRVAEREALTRVIRTMAHEVNNSMAGILSTIGTVTDILGATSGAALLVEPLRACSDRAESLTGFIRDFAKVVRVPEPNLILTDFQELVEPIAILLEGMCSRFGVRLKVDLEQAAPLRLDLVLMQQVVVNIVKNAAESAASGGEVCVRADGRTLTVTDNGPGISADAEEHLFTALYSTKPDGQGLGLMLVGEILSRHRADFSLRTVAPRVTVFTITFPRP